MSGFAQRSGSLFCEGVSLEAIASEYGTPTYVYSRQSIEQAFLAYQSALSDRPHLICYAVKANSNLAVLNVLAQLGGGFDVVSVGAATRAKPFFPVSAKPLRKCNARWSSAFAASTSNPRAR